MSITQTITTLPDPPTRSDPDNFDADADNFVSALPTFQQELNTFAGQLNDTEDDINNVLPASYKATSTSSVMIGTGSKTFTLDNENKAFIAGCRVRIARTTNPSSDYMQGTVTSFTNGELVVNVTTTGGSGTYSDWSISLVVDGDAETLGGMSYAQAMATVNLVAYTMIPGAL